MSGQMSDGAEPNLTPILDMVFQLITFFMLVINFKGQSLDQSLQLPVLGSARPLDWKGEREPLVLNVDVEGKVKFYGKEIVVETEVAKEARLLKDRLRLDGKLKEDGELPVPVIIRGDKGVRFHLLNHIIKVCQDQGYRQFELSAMTRAEGK